MVCMSGHCTCCVVIILHTTPLLSLPASLPLSSRLSLIFVLPCFS